MILLITAVSLVTNAQDASNIGTQRNVATTGRIPDTIAPQTGSNSALIPSMEGDDEFGEQVIIERASNWYPFSLQASVTGYRTTNAELANSGAVSDNYLRGLLSLDYTPLIKGNLFADIGFSEEMYRYRNLSDLDFDYQRAHAGLYYYVPDADNAIASFFENGFFFANYAWYRVADSLFGQDVFTNNSVVLGFQKAIAVQKGHQFYYGLSSDLSFSSSSQAFQRNEYRIYAGYSVMWTEDISTYASYTASCFDYEQAAQNDWNHVAEIGATCVAARPTIFGNEGEIYLQGSVNFTLNDSNIGTQDYEYFSWGGGVGFRTSF